MFVYVHLQNLVVDIVKLIFDHVNLIRVLVMEYVLKQVQFHLFVNVKQAMKVFIVNPVLIIVRMLYVKIMDNDDHVDLILHVNVQQKIFLVDIVK